VNFDQKLPQKVLWRSELRGYYSHDAIFPERKHGRNRWIVFSSRPPGVSTDPTAGSGSGAGSNPVVVDEEEKVPTVSEAYAAQCENLSEKYLLVKNISGEGKSQKTKKVKICHQSAKGEHAIIVACPALKAHRKHDDYLGACKVD
jgi:hypothetical protein